jgi:hypothetical protein
MRNIKLAIPDNKFAYFLRMIRKMDFVKVLEKDSDFEISENQKKDLEKCLKEHNENPEEGKNWKDVKKRLDKLV